MLGESATVYRRLCKARMTAAAFHVPRSVPMERPESALMSCRATSRFARILTRYAAAADRRLSCSCNGNQGYIRRGGRQECGMLEPVSKGPMRIRTLFPSDIHLGTKGCQADKLLDFLRNHEAETIYLVGDIDDR